MERKVSYYSDGLKIAALQYEPDDAEDGSCPGIVMCQGSLGTKEYFWYPHISRHLMSLGYVVLSYDFRGIGESEGEKGRLYPLEHAEDIRNALTYLEIHPKVDPQRLGLFGMSLGGGMVPYVAGVDERVKCAISVLGWADGRELRRSNLRTWEWQELLERIDVDRKSRVLTGKSEIFTQAPGMDPHVDEARHMLNTTVPGMEGFISTPYSLATVEKDLEFRPIDVVDRISPRAIFYIAAEKDTLCPVDGVIEMYQRTKEPKKLKIVPGIRHHGFYAEPHLSQLIEMSSAYLREHLPAKQAVAR